MPDLLADPATPARRGAPVRPSRPAPRRPEARQGSRVLVGVKAALIAAIAGLLIVEAIVLIVWAGESRSAAPLSAALRTGAAFWLLGHGGRLHLPAGTAGLLPLGLTAIFAGLCAHAGAVVARVRPSGPRSRTALASAVAVGVPYALLAALVAGIAGGGGMRASVVTALIGGFVLATVSATVGAVRELPMAVPKRTARRAIVVGAAVAGGVLLAASALLAAIMLTVHLPDAAALAKPAKAGAVGGMGLLALQASVTPNVVTWSAAYLLGPGFAVGSGTLVSPTSTHLGDVPALPIMAGLPAGAASWPLYVLFILPAVAGVLGAVTAIRRMPRPPRALPAAVVGLSIGAVVGVAAAAAALLSGGPVTGGRLATVGPSALPVGLFAALEVGGSGLIAALAVVWIRHRARVAAVREEPTDTDDRSDGRSGFPGGLRRVGSAAARTARKAVPSRAWFPRRLRRAEPPPAEPADLVVDLTKDETRPDAAAVSLGKQRALSVHVEDEPTVDHAAPSLPVEDEPTVDHAAPRLPVDDQPTVEIPVIRNKRGRRPHLPKRGRRKPKEIKLPD